MSDLIVTNLDGQLLVDSRLIAERLGIQHRVLFRTINKYLTELQGFGHLRFENAGVTNSVGASNSVRFAYLNENQASLLMTMSRNTAQVLACKIALVDAFSKAKAIIATVIPAQIDRIRELELELQLTKAQQKLIDTRNTIVQACPKPIADRILGVTEVKDVEYRDRVIKDEEIVNDGSTVFKGEICQRLGILTRNGKPDYKRLNAFLDRLPPDAFKQTVTVQENLALRREWLPALDRMWYAADRNMYLGESD